MNTLDIWEAEAMKPALPYPPLFEEVTEMKTVILTLINLVRAKDEALKSCKKFMNEAWDGKINSWKFRPGWDEANQKIMDAHVLTESLGEVK